MSHTFTPQAHHHRPRRRRRRLRPRRRRAPRPPLWTHPARSRRHLRPRRNPHLRRAAAPRAHSLAREFPRSMISKRPSPTKSRRPATPSRSHQAAGFSDWRLTVDGMVAQPTSLSLSDLRSLPFRSQITEVACEEGWSYIAEWIGTPLAKSSTPSASCPRPATSSTAPSKPTGGTASTWPTPSIPKPSSPGA